MTATVQRPVPAALPPAVRARAVLWGVLAANVLVAEVLFVTSGEGKNSLLSVAKFLGLHAALVMMLQILLVARLPWLDRRIGMDRLPPGTAGWASPCCGRSCCTRPSFSSGTPGWTGSRCPRRS